MGPISPCSRLNDTSLLVTIACRYHLRIDRLPRGTQRGAAGWSKRWRQRRVPGRSRCPWCRIGADGPLKRQVLTGRPQLAMADRIWPAHDAELETASSSSERAAVPSNVVRPRTQLLLELQRVTRDRCSRLLVAIFESRDEPKAHGMAFTAQNGIEAVDFTVPNQELLQTPGYSSRSTYQRALGALYRRTAERPLVASVDLRTQL